MGFWFLLLVREWCGAYGLRDERESWLSSGICSTYLMGACNAIIGLVLEMAAVIQKKAWKSCCSGSRLFIWSYLNQVTTPSINVLSFGKVKMLMEVSRQDSVFLLLPSFYSVFTTECILQFHPMFGGKLKIYPNLQIKDLCLNGGVVGRHWTLKSHSLRH